MKKISLLGSTGSIGTQALDVARMQGYKIVALTANSRVDIIENQAREFKPEIICMMEFENAQTAQIEIPTFEDNKQIDLPTLFDEFYEKQNGQSMSDDMKELLQETMEQIGGLL